MDNSNKPVLLASVYQESQTPFVNYVVTGVILGVLLAVLNSSDVMTFAFMILVYAGFALLFTAMAASVFRFIGWSLFSPWKKN